MSKTHQAPPEHSQPKAKVPQTDSKRISKELEGSTDFVAALDTLALTPVQMNHLQRTIGNRALHKIITRQSQPLPLATNKLGRRIQRALPAADQFTDVSDPVSTAVGEYNALAKPTTAPMYQIAFNAMQKVERVAYSWFDTFTATNQKFGTDAKVVKMNDLLAKLELEHKAMIESSKNLAEVLPFDPTGLSPTQIAAMKALWQDIVNNRGKIKLVGSDDFNKNVLSQLGRILSTPTGRQMLGFLNSPPPSGYKRGENPKLTDIHIGETVSQLPAEVRAASPELEDQNRAEAQPLNIDEDHGRTVENMTAVVESKPFFKPKASDYPAVDAAHLSVIRDAMMGGKKGFTYNGKKYKFNKQRTGAFVTNVADSSIHPAKGTGNQIQSPTWVTLGHELGHAANMRGGATTLKANELSGLGGKGDEAEKWDNPEELINIENIENALRKESGLTERFGHRPPDWLLAIAPKVRQHLKKPLDELYKLNREKYNSKDHPEWDTTYKLVSTMKAKTAIDPEGLDVVKKAVKKFLDDHTDDTTDLKLHTKTIALYDLGIIEINKLLPA